MNILLQTNFYSKLSADKIKINWNKRPIKMGLFLSFLKDNIELKRSHDHLGSTTGWTKLHDESLKLVIGGGMLGDTEYLDSIQYGTKLDNPYNNYVNPFYLFDILTKEGREFFLNYYKDEIESILTAQKSKIETMEHALLANRALLKELETEIEDLKSSCV